MADSLRPPSCDFTATLSQLPELERQVRSSHGSDRVWAYRNVCLLKDGFYSSDELMDMALEIGFDIQDPFTRVRRGTTIRAGVSIDPASAIEGSDVAVGAGTTLKGARLSGSRICIGSGNRITGDIPIDNLTVGDSNEIEGLLGRNEGTVIIGNVNRVAGVRIANTGGSIVIGDNNELCPGLNINIPFAGNRILIGHRNSLGRDGGGVVSTSYRFGRKWGGDVLIGNRVETTRGAEVLGFSVLGWPGELMAEALGLDEANLVRVFVDGSLEELTKMVFRPLFSVPLTPLGGCADEAKMVSLFGAAKIKRCCLTGKVTLKDDTRIQSSYVRDVLLPERCNVYYSSIAPATRSVVVVSMQERTMERVAITEEKDWTTFPNVGLADQYPLSDADYYGDWSWDAAEARSAQP